jgi:hypothetical protein
MQVFPTAPSPTVTHLMNRDALDAMAKAQGGRGTSRGMQSTRGEARSASCCCLVWLWLVESL